MKHLPIFSGNPSVWLISSRFRWQKAAITVITTKTAHASVWDDNWRTLPTVLVELSTAIMAFSLNYPIFPCTKSPYYRPFFNIVTSLRIRSVRVLASNLLSIDVDQLRFPTLVKIIARLFKKKNIHGLTRRTCKTMEDFGTHTFQALINLQEYIYTEEQEARIRISW